MAEAHSAVAFSFAITHEGWDVNFDREVLNLVWQSGIRSWKKRFARFMNSVHNGVYPAHLWTLWITMCITSAIHFSGYKVPYDLVTKVMPLLPGSCVRWQLIGSMLAAMGLWLSVIFTMRYMLKLLLLYKGWMYESRAKGSKPSTFTKFWLLVVRVFSGWNTPKLYSFQGSLPKLPLPALHDTMTRYLRSARPLLDEDNYKKMEGLASDFENGIGVKLQRYLVLKSWWSSNYVSDWWEEYVYLRGRSPLMINSNFYGVDTIMMDTDKGQAARAASAINSCLHYRRLVERQELQPILIQGLVPLCSWQYERIFNTTRIPGIETDKIQHWSDSNHIVVYHKGRYYKVIIYKGRILKPNEIQEQIEYILNDASEPLPGEEKLAALTAGERTTWANARRVYFNTGVNKISLDTIEKAAFVVTLDDVPYEYDSADPTKLDKYGKTLLHGKGYDRWFDKSFTLCIGSNGRLGFNAEHSWADAAVMSHIWELVLCDDTIRNRYENDMKIKDVTPPTPMRLKWDMKSDCQSVIETAVVSANNLIADLDLKIYVHDAYGKGFMKKAKVSPDAYLQMALQLAYYRDSGKFSLTYEASMTRLFREGRTETVRPCTIESSEWVKSMDDPKISTEERIRLMQAACVTHQKGYQDAMCGKGIDRHLFCLYVVSKYLEVDSPFLQKVLSEPWRLSTSQTPHGQTGRIDLKKHPKCISAGGGFGPVADDGYGVSYIIAGEDVLFFHISNKRSSNQTDCHRFADHIRDALADIKSMFVEPPKQNGKA
ncbi:PREDICTED: carnitine O-palmitoyltransferase 1, liver isoform isoform X2 [Nicrophorus vespilloides]|uniref:Carnitine O-palmitoyltransferase 1, liver isoform isoform X2 n=1 Tax=Nicrophorus vespilloides TaxID=110193 RepID=A0ABM1NFK5_NICVS|nr:PREDICTED: carnitine O-palmitoyltransferase 1, liver isoform isoform X2 [Nicrophorus vespilloides]